MDNDPRWITDKMPNDDGTYLATLKTDQGTVFVETICVFDGNWETEKLKVLAWMPLPPVYIPPKECEQNAVEVVRCKDCRYASDVYNDGSIYCCIPNKPMRWHDDNPEWYCADGKPKDGEQYG